MQRELFDNLTYQFEVLNKLEIQTATLQAILRKLELPGSDIQLILSYNTKDGTGYEIPTYYDINQELIPYNLKNEIKVIISDSIDEIQRQMSALNQQLK